MKRYLLFLGLDYYPNGGWSDYKGSFETLEAARREKEHLDSGWAWWHVVDTNTGEVVHKYPVTK